MNKRMITMGLSVLAAGGCAALADTEEGARGRLASAIVSPDAAAVSEDVPVTLFRYGLSSGSTAFGAYVLQGNGRGAVAIELRGCTETAVRRMFSVVTADIVEAAPRPKFDTTIACPSAIAAGAHVVVEPSPRGSSYVQMPNAADAGADGGAAPTYFKIPNRCVGLLDAFDVEQLVQAEAPGSSSVPPPPTQVGIELSCGDELDAPTEGVWEVGTARFAGQGAVYVKGGNFAILFGRVNHAAMTPADAKSAREIVKKKLVELLAGAAIVRDGYRTLFPSFTDPGRAQGLDVAATLPVVDLCTTRSCAGFVPQHAWVNGNDEPVCVTAVSGNVPSSCDPSTRLRGANVLRADGRQACVVGIGVPALGTSSAMELPSCSEGAWTELLGLDVQATPAPWFNDPVHSDPATGDLAAILARGSHPTGVVALPNLPPHDGCAFEIAQGTDLSTVSIADLSESCDDPSVVDITFPTSAELDGAPFVLDAAELPGVGRVRIHGPSGGGGATVRVTEPTCGLGTARPCKSLVPAIQIKGGLFVEWNGITFSGSDAPLTGAPALARVAMQIAGSADAPAHVTLRGVSIGTATGTPFYTGLLSQNADVSVIDTSILAYRRAISASQGSVVVLGEGQRALFRVGLTATGATSMNDLDGTPLDTTVLNFPVLTFGAGARVFAASAVIKGPIGLAWSAGRAAQAVGPDAIFWGTEHDGDVPLSGLSGLSNAMVMRGGGELRFVTSKVHHEGTMLACQIAPGGLAPRVTFAQQATACIAHPLEKSVDPNGHTILRPANLGVCTLEMTPYWRVMPATTWSPTACKLN